MARKKTKDTVVVMEDRNYCYVTDDRNENTMVKKKEKTIPVSDVKNNPYSDDKEIVCKDTGEVCKGSDYFNTLHWKQKKKDLYCMRSGICQKCHDHVYFNMSRVHHVNYDHLGNECKKDLMLLCAKCHAEIHGLGGLYITRRRWYIRQKQIQKRGEAIPAYATEELAELETEQDLEWWFEMEKAKIPATEKQIIFAKTISETLNVELPKTNTKDAYRDFISKYVDIYNIAKKGGKE